jgi:hypothetical protein
MSFTESGYMTTFAAGCLPDLFARVNDGDEKKQPNNCEDAVFRQHANDWRKTDVTHK